jgi:CRP-like cAMP-binding protein
VVADSFRLRNRQLLVAAKRYASTKKTALEERSFSLQTHSAEERYNDFLKREPEAILRISLGHIASYLGISQETLSRIRKK